jgi:hypothetical protein
MYKFIFGVVLISMSCMSCAEKQKTYKESEVNAKIDSIVGERIADLSRKAMTDLEDRIAIDVKVKTDSILAARAKEKTPATAAPVAADSAE